MSTAASSDYDTVLKTVSAWPVKTRLAFAQDLLATLQSESTSVEPKRGDTLSRALGLARAGSPPPDDAEVARILDERRMEKYGR